MSHHLIDISATDCTVTCRRGQLICKTTEGSARTISMEDVGAILINSFSAEIHNRVFLDAARLGTVIVFCENFRPAAVLLPANRATDTSLMRAQIGLSAAAKRALWLKTITAKCVNQAAYARQIEPLAPRTLRIARAAARSNIEKEAACARLYWATLATHIGATAFKRNRQHDGLNSLLNYGYAVLLARVLQKMFAVGIDPTFGIGHVTRERATPLAYDLMEPFRVAVEARIAQWICALRARNPEDLQELEVSQEYKRWLLGFLTWRVPYEGRCFTLENLIEHVLHGFREAVRAKRPTLYKPWILESTKWDGFS